MTGTDLLRLAHIEVRGLFGMYDHEINLKLDDRVTLLHGPNGVGKTTVLRMAYALLRGNLAFFRTAPMHSFAMRFHDGTEIQLTGNGSTDDDKDTHQLTLFEGSKTNTAHLNIRALTANLVAGKLDFLRPLNNASDTWIDLRDDEVLTGSEVISRYGNRETRSSHEEMRSIEWFQDFLNHAKAHLIESQRLIQTSPEKRRTRYYMESSPAVSSVIECGRDFQKRLGATMANYGRNAQTLDQSFPQRLISASETLKVDDLQKKMTNLDSKTAELKEMGILDETPVHPFDITRLEGKGDSTQARVMTLYVQDTDKKLMVLDDLASRTHMFLENVNKKFRHKKIRIDREAGLVAVGDGGQQLPLDSLSSGEQHELVLHYDLLFRVPANTVVLIDEPELSLHVAWQKKFLPDLLEIVRLSQFDALLATHSPYIIGERDDLMVPLTDSE